MQLLKSVSEVENLEAIPGDRVSRNEANEIVGTSEPARRLQELINAVAPSGANVFISGESGTGKELVARALHKRSGRDGKPFVAINCAALPRDILENELFGHERGAFTGAIAQKSGCIEQAHEGTLFLDEIGEMSVETQAKLLRVIESQSFRRLGGKTEVIVDVRIVAATNRDTAEAVATGILRPDLYYRLNVVEIVLEPLRNRRDDIPLLARHFLNMFCLKYSKNVTGFATEYLERVQAYDWPGNIRELRNSIERAVVLCTGDTISSNDMPVRIQRMQQEIRCISIPIGSTVEEAEKKLILETLDSVGNNKAKAARILGVSRKTLHNKLNIFALGALATRLEAGDHP